jgi:hypothetical protein
MHPDRELGPVHDPHASRPAAPAEQEPCDGGPPSSWPGDWQGYPVAMLDVLLDAG